MTLAFALVAGGLPSWALLLPGLDVVGAMGFALTSPAGGSSSW